ncbi:MAG TPA: HAMP domain-containing sensor histidine kinase [Longimicrobiales bacterium]|nr:HAMP domain-containing sensor histidine kinase [Longimicrobiales bacterium]
MADHIADSSSPDPHDSVAVVAEATRRVLRRVLQAVQSTPDSARGPDEHVLLEAEALRDALKRLLQGEDPARLVSALPSTAVPLVGLLRAEILRDEVHSPGTVLSAVRALERLERTWRSGADAGSEPDLRSWLSRPDALELVVELAHDLRSPLTSIMFLSETIQNGDTGALTDVQHRQLSLIYISALGLSSVVSDVVEMAVDEQDLVDPQDATDFWVAEVLEGVVTLVHPMAEEKGLDLRIHADADARWTGHPSALSRVLLNLATNALKFTETGFVEIGMRRIRGAVAEFYVEDTGRGIDEKQLEELLLPFRRRGRDGGHHFSASGLGLSICQRYLRQMGSELEVETGPGEGTRFFFRLEAYPVG